MTAIRILAVFNNNMPQNEAPYYITVTINTVPVLFIQKKKSLSIVHDSSLPVFQEKKRSKI